MDELYALTDHTTKNFNRLSWKFLAVGSDFETVAREVVAMDIHFIAIAYGFEADVETLIRERIW